MHVTLLPAFSDNYVFAVRCGTGIAAVDPGDAEVVEHHLQDTGQPLAAILITHHHPDHIGGMARLSARWPDARRIGPDDPRIPGLTEIVGDGAQLTIDAEGSFEVISVPGHTRSHIAYRGNGAVFCGDVLFSLGCGRVFEGSPEQMLASLDRLAALPEATRVFCAHEYTLANARFAQSVDPDNPDLKERVTTVQSLRANGLPSIPTDIGSERRCNPFLRCDDPRIIAAAAAHAEHAMTSRSEVFATLRSWKNLS